MICYLRSFFEQFNVDKETLIKELENINSKKEQNSIYDIVKEKKEEKVVGLNVNGQQQGQNVVVPGKLELKKRKRGCC